MANKDKLLESAQKFLAKGQLPKAIGEYQKVVEAFPKDYRNRQKLAELLSREKRNDEAQPHYEAVAKNFTETGFYLKAIAIYKQMQKIEPGRVDIYLRLAELNEKQGLIGNALNEYRSLVAFYDKNRMGRETIGVLQKMIALEPDNLGFRGKLIETFVAIGETADALEQLRTLVKLLIGKGEHAKVVKLYEKFLDLCPEDVENRLPLAEALLANDQAEKALALLKGLLKQAPDHPALLTVLTDCHMALGNHADARLTCQHLLKEHPQDLDLRERYVRVCIAGADHERALACLEEAKEAFSEADRVGVLKELYEALQQALPDNARLQATLAAIYAAIGEGGGQPHFASAGQAGVVEEETADAAVLDAAIGDVENLDLVGEPVAPPAEVPPLGAPASPAKPVKAKGGFELELDLDLDLDLPSAAPPPVAPPPVAAPVPPETPPEPAVPAVEPPLPPVTVAPPQAPPLDMEMELDLGGLDELEIELPAVEPSLPVEHYEPAAAIPEPELPSAPETAVEEMVNPSAAAEFEADAEDFSLPDLGELEFEVEIEAPPEIKSVEELADLEFPDLEESEPSSWEEAAAVAAEISPVVEEAEPVVEEAEPVFEEAEPFVEEETGPAAFVEVEALEPHEEAEEIEEIEELEEIEEFEVLDEFAEIEELEEAEELAEAEELEELEEIESLEELDEVAEIAEEAVSVPAEAESIPLQQLSGDLEEAEFYLRQGLFDDAERVVLGLQQRYGDVPDLTAKLAEINTQRQVAAETEEKNTVFDLMADIKDSELLGATDFLDDAPGDAADEFSLAESTEDDEDAQSHFDLGIAYKEMGLLDDAIAEFGKALKDPARQLDCLTLKGQCLAELGHCDRAEETYKEGLMLAGLTEEGMVALRYELGLLYETLGRPVEALESFQVVADRDLFYRDVTDKLKNLRQQLGIDDQAIEAISEGGSGGGSRDRISFL